MRRGDDRVTARREGRMLGGEPCEVSHVRGGQRKGRGRVMAARKEEMRRENKIKKKPNKHGE